MTAFSAIEGYSDRRALPRLYNRIAARCRFGISKAMRGEEGEGRITNFCKISGCLALISKDRFILEVATYSLDNLPQKLYKDALNWAVFRYSEFAPKQGRRRLGHALINNDG